MFFLLLLFFIGGRAFSIPEKVFYDLEDAEAHFDNFMKTHNKQYSSEEEKNKRLEIFKKNLEWYNEKNKIEEMAVYAIDRFADLAPEEFESMHTGLRDLGTDSCNVAKANFTSLSAPESFDWRDQNKVTRVKNQHQCKSCWSFSVTGNLESQYAIKHSQLKEFSEQQLIDCFPGSGGCAVGSDMGQAFAYLTTIDGLESEENYPFDQSNMKQCRHKNQPEVKVTGCKRFSVQSEDELVEILNSVGPLSIGVNAADFTGYNGGILHNCRQGGLNHAVLLVGYGVEQGHPIWMIKNSYGPDWGESGYIKVKRNVNSCSMTEMIYSATIE